MEDLAGPICHGYKVIENAKNAMNNVDNTCLKFEKRIGLLLSSQGKSVDTSSSINHGKGIK